MKALGRGLSFPLNQVDVGFRKAAGIWRQIIVKEGRTARMLNLVDLDLASGSYAALARIGSLTEVSIRDISGLG